MSGEWTLLVVATIVMSVAMCAVGFFIERPKPRMQEHVQNRRSNSPND